MLWILSIWSLIEVLKLFLKSTGMLQGGNTLIVFYRKVTRWFHFFSHGKQVTGSGAMNYIIKNIYMNALWPPVCNDPSVEKEYAQDWKRHLMIHVIVLALILNSHVSLGLWLKFAEIQSPLAGKITCLLLSKSCKHVHNEIVWNHNLWQNSQSFKKDYYNI